MLFHCAHSPLVSVLSVLVFSTARTQRDRGPARGGQRRLCAKRGHSMRAAGLPGGWQAAQCPAGWEILPLPLSGFSWGSSSMTCCRALLCRSWCVRSGPGLCSGHSLQWVWNRMLRTSLGYWGGEWGAPRPSSACSRLPPHRLHQVEDCRLFKGQTCSLKRCPWARGISPAASEKCRRAAPMPLLNQNLPFNRAPRERTSTRSPRNRGWS